MNKTVRVLLIVAGIIVGLIAVVIALGIFVNNRVDKIGDNLDILVSQNDDTDMTEVVYTIKNNSTATQQLDSIDIDLDAFQYAKLGTINLKRTDEYSAFGMRSFEFRKDIAPGETLEVKFDFKRKSTMSHFIETDICINNPGTCVGGSFDL